MSSREDTSLAAGCRTDCNGCAHRALSPQASEAQKADWLARALSLWREVLAPIHGVRGEARWGYRERVTLSAQWAAEGDAPGAWRIG
ncbi:MAG TPA: hypothetical protein ENH21_05670, partial [Chromatiales bacterium]|nr:hypothetical protein [Chromatiales bacterium]HEX22902.1 hypothetical protein [Chromatiales bacterium]